MDRNDSVVLVTSMLALVWLWQLWKLWNSSQGHRGKGREGWSGVVLEAETKLMPVLPLGPRKQEATGWRSGNRLPMRMGRCRHWRRRQDD